MHSSGRRTLSASSLDIQHSGNNLTLPRTTSENAPNGIHYFTLAGRGGFLQQCSGGDQHPGRTGPTLGSAMDEEGLLELVVQRAPLRQTFYGRDLPTFYLPCRN